MKMKLGPWLGIRNVVPVSLFIRYGSTIAAAIFADQGSLTPQPQPAGQRIVLPEGPQSCSKVDGTSQEDRIVENSKKRMINKLEILGGKIELESREYTLPFDPAIVISSEPDDVGPLDVATNIGGHSGQPGSLLSPSYLATSFSLPASPRPSLRRLSSHNRATLKSSEQIVLDNPATPSPSKHIPYPESCVPNWSLLSHCSEQLIDEHVDVANVYKGEPSDTGPYTGQYPLGDSTGRIFEVATRAGQAQNHQQNDHACPQSRSASEYQPFPYTASALPSQGSSSLSQLTYVHSHASSEGMYGQPHQDQGYVCLKDIENVSQSAQHIAHEEVVNGIAQDMSQTSEASHRNAVHQRTPTERMHLNTGHNDSDGGFNRKLLQVLPSLDERTAVDPIDPLNHIVGAFTPGHAAQKIAEHAVDPISMSDLLGPPIFH